MRAAVSNPFKLGILTSIKISAKSISFSKIFNADSRYLNLGGAENGRRWEGKYTGAALLYCTFKKKVDAPFAIPTDSVLEGDVLVPAPTVNDILGHKLGLFGKIRRRFHLMLP